MDFKNKLSLKEFEVSNANSSNLAGNFCGENKIFDVKLMSSKLNIKIISLNKFDLEFDLIGYDPAIVNALRRILLSDIPSMAIEKIHMYQNTSIMQDEVLSHRLGLLPLTADPRLFDWPGHDWSPETGTESNTLEFSLNVRCTKGSEPGELKNSHVTTSHLNWEPKGDQREWLGSDNPGPAQADILINKLRPGHEMEIRMFAVKGLGRDHAKFSPVATAFYRLMPSIRLTRPVTDAKALKLQSCFSPGVIEIKDGEAKVVDERNDTCSRNVYRYPELAETVQLEKVKDHFIFTVESVGSLPPEELVCLAWDVIIEKCDHFITELEDVSEKK